jgi:hypothetical protein
MTRIVRHIHKYQKVKWGKKKTIIWRCVLEGCPHYLHNEVIEKRKSLCHKCNRPFIMTKDKMRRVQPRCDMCQHGKDPIYAKLDELIGNL